MLMSHSGLVFVCFICYGIFVAAEYKFCEHTWAYHKPTRTCIRLFQWGNTHRESIGGCKLYDGHMVYILDEDTNNFVKDLLAESFTKSALIGLFYRARNGVYKWGDTNVAPVYTDWKYSWDRPDVNRTSVVITAGGWETFPTSKETAHVCQMDAAIPKPEMTCPPFEVGKESPSINCTIEVPDHISFMGLRLDRDGTYVTNCSTDACEKTDLGQASSQAVDLAIEYKVTASLSEIRNNASRNITWSCSVRLSETLHPVTSYCEQAVYTRSSVTTATSPVPAMISAAASHITTSENISRYMTSIYICLIVIIILSLVIIVLVVVTFLLRRRMAANKGNLQCVADMELTNCRQSGNETDYQELKEDLEDGKGYTKLSR